MTEQFVDPRHPMFRLDGAGAEKSNPHHPRSTRRPPGNVPYVVDNLWEWMRPAEFPSRRHCVCASPSADLARALGGAADGIVFRVLQLQCAKIAQIPQQDAKFHPEAKSLHKTLVKLLDANWLGAAPLEDKDKRAIAPLWMPCLTKDEVNELFKLPRLAKIKGKLQESIRFWQDARLLDLSGPWPFPEGEIFFEAKAWSLVGDKTEETFSPK